MASNSNAQEAIPTQTVKALIKRTRYDQPIIEPRYYVVPNLALRLRPMCFRIEMYRLVGMSYELSVEVTRP